MENNKRISWYGKWRSTLLWGGILAAIGIVGGLLVRELSAPLSQPKITPTEIVGTVPPKTEPPTEEAKKAHDVPSHHPRYLAIPKLNVHTNIYAVGVTQGAIDAPQTAWGVGWYKDGALPGNGSGAALIDGHVNDAFNTPGVFYKLSELVAGDGITIIRGDDSELRYKVVKIEEEPLKSIDMNKVLSSVEAGTEGLNLITCGGKYDQAARTYTNRVIVYAVRV